MSKKNRGHASSLSELSTITQEQPAETAVAEIAENILATDVSDLLDTHADHAILATSADEAVAIIDAMVAEEEARVDAWEDCGLQVDVAAIAADGPAIASIEAAEEAVLAPPVDAPPDAPTPGPVPDEVPAVAATAVPGNASDLIANLQAKIASLKEGKAKRVASGSKPRPNVTYTLLERPLNWSSTPQVAQLQQILFDPAFMAKHRNAEGIVKIAEPDVFAAITAGAAAGVLRTKQEPVRILQYYRSALLNANCLRWA
jgi:hypothetical protein